MTKAYLRHYMAQWKRVHAFEKKELLSTSPEQKLAQLAGLMASFRLFKSARSTLLSKKEIATVRNRWHKLRHQTVHA